MAAAQTQFSRSQKAVILKLEAEIEALHKRHLWTDEEIVILKSMIKAWRGWMAVGGIFGGVRNVLVYITIFAGGVMAVRSGLLAFLGIGG